MNGIPVDEWEIRRWTKHVFDKGKIQTKVPNSLGDDFLQNLFFYSGKWAGFNMAHAHN